MRITIEDILRNIGKTYKDITTEAQPQPNKDRHKAHKDDKYKREQKLPCLLYILFVQARMLAFSCDVARRYAERERIIVVEY